MFDIYFICFLKSKTFSPGERVLQLPSGAQMPAIGIGMCPDRETPRTGQWPKDLWGPLRTFEDLWGLCLRIWNINITWHIYVYIHIYIYIVCFFINTYIYMYMYIMLFSICFQCVCNVYDIFETFGLKLLPRLRLYQLETPYQRTSLLRNFKNEGDQLLKASKNYPREILNVALWT